MVTRIDLRVHTTAPSSRRDDEQFKAQAEAYGSFVASSTFMKRAHDDSLAAKDGPPYLRQLDVVPTNMILDIQSTSDHQIGELTELAYDPTTFLEETQLGYTALESQLFVPPSRISTKALTPDVRPIEDKTTEVSKPESGPHELDHSRHDGSSSSHQVPSQSSYLKSPALDRSNKKPRINNENRHLFSTRKSLLPVPTALLEAGSHGVSNAAEDRQRSTRSQRHASNPVQNSDSVDDVTSELPTSYSLSDITSASSRSRQHSIQRSASDPGLSPAEAVGSVLVRQEDASPEDGPRRIVGLAPSQGFCPPEVATSAIALACPVSARPSGSDTVVKDFANLENIHKETDDIVPELRSYSDLPTSIRPPAPQPSLQPFKTHITESLRYLGQNVNLAQCYKPIFVSRDLRQSERGYWGFDITLWPVQLRTDFFQFLAKMIETGRVGWGIWCAREPADLEVRVFCWGEVAKHVYLMLYVASKSKVRKLGLRWIDADGEVVVQMRGPDNDNRELPT